MMEIFQKIGNIGESGGLFGTYIMDRLHNARIGDGHSSACSIGRGVRFHYILYYTVSGEKSKPLDNVQ